MLGTRIVSLEGKYILLFDCLSFLNIYWIVTVVHVYSFINVRDNSISGFRWIALSRNFYINLLSIKSCHAIYAFNLLDSVNAVSLLW